MEMLLVLLCCAPGAQALAQKWGPPLTLDGGGKMSNTLDMWPAGFASGSFRFNGPPSSEGVVFSVDGAATFHKAEFNMTVNRTWDSFVTYRNGSDVWAHDFGTTGECIRPATATATSLTSSPTTTYRVEGGQLTSSPGPVVTFSGLPEPLCRPPKADPKFFFTVYAGGQLVLADGTHLVTGMYTVCPGGKRNGGIHMFSSKDGYSFEFVSHVARQSDQKGFALPAEGPNEHTVTLLANGNILCVFRTEAGDGNGHYGPYYHTTSTDGGKTWTPALPLKDTDGNYIGCARPHMVQLGNVTLLAGGRMMMGKDYSRGFSIWMSTDGNGLNWTRADGSYHHNARASETHAPLWPASVNRTGWRFEFTSGYIGLVRVGESSAAVIYDLMLPAPAPPRPPPGPAPPPAPPGACKGKITVHHTLGCFNYSSWSSASPAGPVLPAWQPTVEGKADLPSCAAACYTARMTKAGIDDGKHCFCGTDAELGSATAKALSRPKTECLGVPCQGDASEKECGGVGRMLAYDFTCERTTEGPPAEQALPTEVAATDFHNPSISFSMRIDLNV